MKACRILREQLVFRLWRIWVWKVEVRDDSNTGIGILITIRQGRKASNSRFFLSLIYIWTSSMRSFSLGGRLLPLLYFLKCSYKYEKKKTYLFVGSSWIQPSWETRLNITDDKCYVTTLFHFKVVLHAAQLYQHFSHHWETEGNGHSVVQLDISQTLNINFTTWFLFEIKIYQNILLAVVISPFTVFV